MNIGRRLKFWRPWSRRRTREAELDLELRDHIELEAEEQREAGVSPDEATYAARRALGNATQIKEDVRMAWGLEWLETLLQDLRFGLRQVRRNPGFAAIVVIVLALGCGTNIAIFDLVDNVMLQALPVSAPQQLVLLGWRPRTSHPKNAPLFHAERPGEVFSYPAYTYLRRHTQALSSVFGYANASWKKALVVKLKGRNTFANGIVVTGGYFSGLGVRPAAGRLFTPSDEKPDARPVVDISYQFWTREFARSRSAIGQVLIIDGSPFTIAGVTPPQFFGTEPGKAPDFWEPIGQWEGIRHDMANMFTDRTSATYWWLTLMGRLKPDVMRDRARSELNVLFQQSLTATPDHSIETSELPVLKLSPGERGTASLRQMFSHSLLLWMLIAGLALLVACANVAVLMLARATTRRSEMAVRLSLGASRLRLTRQLLIESCLLAGFAGALGATFAFWGSRVSAALMSTMVEQVGLGIQRSSLDVWVLSFSVGTAVLTGVVCGLAPARLATRADLTSLLKQTGTAEAPAKGWRGLGGRNMLVSLQVAISLLVIIGAGLFVRTVENLEHAGLGFNPRHVLIFTVNASTGGYQKEALADLYARMLDRIKRLPNVLEASCSMTPLITSFTQGFRVTVLGDGKSADETAMVSFNLVGPDFFRAMGIPITNGRGLTHGDMHSARKFAVISEAFAQKFVHGRNAVGSRFSIGQPPEASNTYLIAGVAKNVKYFGPLGPSSVPVGYIPYSQERGTFMNFAYDGMHFEIRTRGNPAALVNAIRNAIDGIDPGLPLQGVETQVEQIDSSLAQQRLVAFLSGFLALFVLLLAGVSLYGIQSYAVTQRTHEIGIRMALGARKADVLRLVVGQGLTLAMIGAAIGIACALGLTRFIAGQLYGVKPTDPLTFTVVSVILLGVALLACYIPARRAAKVDPMVALRHE